MGVFGRLMVCALLLPGAAIAAGESTQLQPWLSVTFREASPLAVGALMKSVSLEAESRNADTYLDVIEADWFKERYYDWREPFGDGDTRWHFLRPPNQVDPPRAAVRFHLSDMSPYRVQALAYCEDPACDELRRLLARMPPPQPSAYAAPSVKADWLKTIRSERCSTAAAETPAGRYPIEERRRMIGGRVELRLVSNHCGEVRGALAVKSSGNRNLDRAARRQALSWRLPAAGAGAFWTTSFQYGGTEAWKAKDESVVTGELSAADSFYP